MGPHDEPLRDRLLAQQVPTPENLARYRQEVEALLEQLRWRRWWVEAVRAVLTTLGAVVLFPLAALFGLMALYFLAGGRSLAEAWSPAAAALVCLAGAVGLVRWFFRRRADDLLLEVKRLQARGLEFEEQLRRQGGR
jgi:hypothetical protein